MRKAQAANETALIVAFMTLFLIVFLAAVSQKLVIATDDRTRGLAEDLADVIESELTLASSAQEGYSRTFQLPFSLDGKQYSILFYDKASTGASFTMVVVRIPLSGGEYTASRVLPDNILGTLSPGNNLVTNAAGSATVTAVP